MVLIQFKHLPPPWMQWWKKADIQRGKALEESTHGSVEVGISPDNYDCAQVPNESYDLQNQKDEK